MYDKDALGEFLHAIPKMDLHCHLLGTIREETFLELNAQQGSPLRPEDIKDFYVRGDKPKGVLHVLRALDEHILLKPEYFRTWPSTMCATQSSSGTRPAPRTCPASPTPWLPMRSSPASRMHSKSAA